jgi:hypothetical protein
MLEAKPRKGMPSPRLNESEFRGRFLAQFADPAYGALCAKASIGRRQARA